MTFHLCGAISVTFDRSNFVPHSSLLQTYDVQMKSPKTDLTADTKNNLTAAGLVFLCPGTCEGIFVRSGGHAKVVTEITIKHLI